MDSSDWIAVVAVVVSLYSIHRVESLRRKTTYYTELRSAYSSFIASAIDYRLARSRISRIDPKGSFLQLNTIRVSDSVEPPIEPALKAGQALLLIERDPECRSTLRQFIGRLAKDDFDLGKLAGHIENLVSRGHFDPERHGPLGTTLRRARQHFESTQPNSNAEGVQP